MLLIRFFIMNILIDFVRICSIDNSLQDYNNNQNNQHANKFFFKEAFLIFHVFKIFLIKSVILETKKDV